MSTFKSNMGKVKIFLCELLDCCHHFATRDAGQIGGCCYPGDPLLNETEV